MAGREGFRRSWIAVGAPLLGLALAGCAAASSVSVGSTPGSLTCVDDSARCLESRRVALENIMKDKSRAWIAKPATPSAYASGVRLFAFMKQKRALSCTELASGLREAQGARAALRSASGQLTTAQIARGALLGDEVATHMRREMRRRGCRSRA